MTRQTRTGLVLILFVAATLLLVPAKSALACGGLFCQNSPVDQNAERIIFAQNRDDTISAIIQIQYTGFAEDFSWILPLPEAISADDLAVPESAVAAFTELEAATSPVFIPPETPRCARQRGFRIGFPGASFADMAFEESVTVFSSGEVGPFGFDVIGSENPDDLINWLRQHDYRVTVEMEPLINVYVEEAFVFLAMRLLPEQGIQDIQPIQVTYPGSRPMIPLRLTAVAANPDMAVLTWFFAEQQAVPVNYAHMVIPDESLTFFAGGGHNYRQRMGEVADEYGGQAFVTEYAAPSWEIGFADPLLQELSRKHAYLTRLNTVISPPEMTVDPIFDFDPQRRDVSNIHDLSQAVGLFDCEREAGVRIRNVGSFDAGSSSTTPAGFMTGLALGGLGIAFAGAILIVGVLIGRWTRRN